ncbi:MAG: modification enzyme MiaB family [Planctomycetaceae bacterium]|nr:modification enzyme MiaB family [Planctomycetaceae bacterium]
MLSIEDLTQRTCRLVTLGCKVNQYETQLVKEALEQNGFREAAEDEAADLCVVNTCTVTAEADAKGRQLIRQLAQRNPGTQTLVMGCFATRDPEAVRNLPGVFEVVTDKRELPDVLQRIGLQHVPSGISRFDGHRRAFVKVQDGCVLRCTYCIIPSVRPGLRSRSPQDIEDEVRRLIDGGFQEIVLCGIHLGHYGVDATRGKTGLPPFRLRHLIQRLDQIPGTWRLRLSSIEAGEVGDDFIAAAADCEHLCPHFHPALQSGSNTVLARMRRRYRTESFLGKIDNFRNRFDQPAFSTDVIVGFPGETEAEFQETLDTCEAAGFSKIHAFPFSARKGTPAADFPDQVAPDVKKERMERLAELERWLAGRYHGSLLGRTLSVMIEGEVRPGIMRGTSCRYAPVEVPGTPADLAKLVPATVTSASSEGLIGVRHEASVCC